MPRLILFSYAIFMGITAVGMASSEARATVIWDVTDGILTGAQNVLVEGTLYNVTFADGSCFDLFDGCNEVSDFDFDTLTAATLAADALLDQVFLDVVEGTFDTDPELTEGCSFLFACFVFIPFHLGPGGDPCSPPVFAVNDYDPLFDRIDTLPCGITATVDTSLSAETTYAKFTKVSEPSSILLFGVGLIGLLGVGRRRRII
jgi:hypothetical protein